MIYFKIVPIIGAHSSNIINNKRFSTFNNKFLTIQLKDVNHEDFLKRELKNRFNTEFLISYSFFVINNGPDIYIYTFVIPKDESFADKQDLTAQEVLESDFDEFDKLAIKDYCYKSF